MASNNDISVIDVLTKVGERIDQWINPFTGMGTSRDKSTHTVFQATPILSDQELSDLYHHNGIAARICECYPNAALKSGFRIKLPNATARETELNQALEDLGTTDQMLKAMIWGRAFGAGVLVLGADDGRPAYMPLDLNSVKGFTFLHTDDKREWYPEQRDFEPTSIDYGRVNVYRKSLNNLLVHRSRLMIFGGVNTAAIEKRLNNGWDYSVLQRAYEALQLFGVEYAAGKSIMQEASISVFTMKGLIRSIASGSLSAILTRQALIDMSKSVTKSVFLDSETEEKYERHAAQFAGIPDMLREAQTYLSAVVDTPVTVLMGRSPAGLNATGESDIRIWYDGIENYRKRQLSKKVLRIAELVGRVRGIDMRQASVEFGEIWLESPLEKATREKMVADTDSIYLTNSVLMPEEVALSRFANAKSDVKINTKSREILPETPAAPKDVIELAPTDLATIITVNEARGQRGLGPVPDGELTLEEYKSKHGTYVAPLPSSVGSTSTAKPSSGPVPSNGSGAV